MNFTILVLSKFTISQCSVWYCLWWNKNPYQSVSFGYSIVSKKRILENLGQWIRAAIKYATHEYYNRSHYKIAQA